MSASWEEFFLDKIAKFKKKVFKIFEFALSKYNNSAILKKKIKSLRYYVYPDFSRTYLEDITTE